MSKRKAKKIEHKVTAADLSANPDLAAAGLAEGDEVEIETEGDVPSYTIRADSLFGIRCMMAVAGLASMLPREEQRAIAVKLREFDLYEEANR